MSRPAQGQAAAPRAPRCLQVAAPFVQQQRGAVCNENWRWVGNVEPVPRPRCSVARPKDGRGAPHPRAVERGGGGDANAPRSAITLVGVDAGRTVRMGAVPIQRGASVVESPAATTRQRMDCGAVHGTRVPGGRRARRQRNGAASERAKRAGGGEVDDP